MPLLTAPSWKAIVKFSELSDADAARYLARVKEDGPARLSELALRMAKDGVDLEQFDATIPSLVPLWSWYMEFARSGFPGIPDDAAPRAHAVEQPVAKYARDGYASEMLTHYLVEVARKCFDMVEWVSDPHVGMYSHRRTALRYVLSDGSSGLAHLDIYTIGATIAFRRGDAAPAEPDFMERGMLDGPFVCPPAIVDIYRAIPRGPSILTGRVGSDRLNDLDFSTDQTIDTYFAPSVEDVAPSPKSVSHHGGELVFAHISANMEELEEAPPLDVVLIVHVLRQLEFLDIDGQPPTVQSVLAVEFGEYVRRDDAMATTLTAGGLLRAVQIASISPSEESWTEISKAFTRLARQLGGRFAPEDEF